MLGVSIGMILVLLVPYGVGFWKFSSMTGSNDDWNNINNWVSLIACLQMFGAAIFALGVAVLCAAYVGTTYTSYAAVFMGIYAASLAIGAMAVAAMVKAT
jgi:hypothetical protein